MKILLLGANGQLGTAFQDLARTDAFPLGWTLGAWSSKDLDLAKTDSLLSKISAFAPEAIINAAAYTAVDLAEKERDPCKSINTDAPAVLARFCKARGIPFVHYSSDYVYEGSGTGDRSETEAHAPKNYYGLTKAMGDEAIVASGSEYLIFRTSWVFSHTGKNFVKTMLRLGAERSELKVVDDQVGAPTYAPDLAKYSLHALMRALELKAQGQKFPSGVYHLTNSGATSWAGFARSILPNTRIIEIPSAEYPTPAARPLNSRLSLAKFTEIFGVTPRPWQDALATCLEKLKNEN